MRRLDRYSRRAVDSWRPAIASRWWLRSASRSGTGRAFLRSGLSSQDRRPTPWATSSVCRRCSARANGTELSLLPISERRGLIEPYARLGLPCHEVVLRALDKSLLQDQAAAVGLAPPTSVICLSAEETLMTARELGFPLVVKPVRSILWTTGQIRQHWAQIVRDKASFRLRSRRSGYR
jgi:hypothetical protein